MNNQTVTQASNYFDLQGLEQLRQKTYITNQGVNFLTLSEAAEGIGFRTLAVRIGFDKLVEEGVTFSTFGIGTDFDEELMMGIAERGKGKYCFLRNSKEIPKLVSKSIHSLLAIAGSEASIQICGLNGAVVTKVYGVDDDDNDAIDNGLSMLSSMIGPSSNSGKSSSLGNITLGDLHTSNTRQVLVELEFSPSSKGELSLPVLEYTLQYTSTNSEISTLSKTTTTETITSLENPETVEETELKTSSSRSDSSRDGLEISGCVNVELTDDKNDSLGV